MAAERTRPAVIADVAALAGVSVPTVSRVLTGSAHVRPATAAKVRGAIDVLNYRPSSAARTLASRQSRTIAIVAGRTSRYGYAETISGLEEKARAGEYTVSITVVESDEEVRVERAVDLVLDQKPAGVALLKFDPPGVATLERLPSDLPVVAIAGVRDKNVPQAVLDEGAAAEDLIDYLLSLGHATVHHVRVPPSQGDQGEDGRTTGWRRALERAGAPVPPVLDATWEPESGRPIGRQLAHMNGVTAVFCGNDEIAMGVMRGLADEGVYCPSDVSVVGFDDHPLAALWTPALTTVDQDFVALGHRAFELLEQRMAGGATAPFSSQKPRLVIRESAAAPNPARMVV